MTQPQSAAVHPPVRLMGESEKPAQSTVCQLFLLFVP